MAELKLTIENYDFLKKAFDKAPQIAADEMGKLVQKAARDITAEAIRQAPVNKQAGGGNLRQSIRYRPTSKVSAIVEATAKYASAVHEGTRPHEIRAVNKKVLADKRRGIIFGKVVRHPGTRPNPFLQKALDKYEGKLNRELTATAETILNKAFKP